MADQEARGESSEVSWVLDSTTVYGTLVRPTGPGSFPAVAMVAGSGPSDRELIARYDAAIAHLLAGEPVAPDPSLPQGVQMLLQSLANPANLPFARELWVADTANWLAQVQAPVLIIIGKKDIQVDWQAGGAPLQHAAQGQEHVVFLFPENANHVLKHEPRPRSELVPAEVAGSYNAPDAHLDPETLTSIIEWLAAHA